MNASDPNPRAPTEIDPPFLFVTGTIVETYPLGLADPLFLRHCDALTDGELPEAQRTEFLRFCERHPAAYRALALGFLEAMAFRQALRSTADCDEAKTTATLGKPDAAPGLSTTDDSVRLPPRRTFGVWLRAALWLVAFGLGWLGHRGWVVLDEDFRLDHERVASVAPTEIRPDPLSGIRSPESERSATATATELDPAEFGVTPWSNLLPGAELAAVEGKPTLMVNSIPDWETAERFASQGGDDPTGLEARWLRQTEPILDEYHRTAWRRAGYDVIASRRLVSIDDRDGRKVKIPVNDFVFQYVGLSVH